MQTTTRLPKLSDNSLAILDAVVHADEPPPASNFIRAAAYQLAELGLINIIGGKAYPTLDGYGFVAKLEAEKSVAA